MYYILRNYCKEDALIFKFIVKKIWENFFNVLTNYKNVIFLKRIVLKNLLINLKNKYVSIYRHYHRLPMFLIKFKQTNNNNEIYRTSVVNNTIVTTKHSRTKKIRHNVLNRTTLKITLQQNVIVCKICSITPINQLPAR